MRDDTIAPVGILCPGDFVKELPVGGTRGFVESLLPFITTPVLLYGIGLNGTLPWQSVEIKPGVTFVAVADFNFSASLQMRFFTLWHFLRWRSRILHSGVSVLYIHNPEMVLPFLFFNPKIPVIFHQHGSGNPLFKAKFSWARTPLFLWGFDLILKTIYRRSDWIIAIDSLCLEQSQKHGAAKKTTMIMNAVDTEKFHPDERSRNEMRTRYNITEDQCIVLFVGRLEEIKRVGLAIESIRQLGSDNSAFRLFIAGDGTLKERLEKQAEQLTAAGNVIFLGSIRHPELPAFYNMADILILPSEMEGVPMVILESLACGTPVIASRVGGIPDIIKEGVNGITLKEVTIEKLTQGVVALKNIRHDRTRVAQSVKHLSTTCFAQNLQAIFKKVRDQKKWSRDQ